MFNFNHNNSKFIRTINCFSLVYLPACLSTCLPANQSFSLSVSLAVCLFICPSIHATIHIPPNNRWNTVSWSESSHTFDLLIVNAGWHNVVPGVGLTQTEVLVDLQDAPDLLLARVKQHPLHIFTKRVGKLFIRWKKQTPQVNLKMFHMIHIFKSNLPVVTCV